MEYNITLDRDEAPVGGIIKATITAPSGFFGHSIVLLLKNEEGKRNTPAKFTDSRVRITPRDFGSSLTVQVEFSSDSVAGGYISAIDDQHGIASNNVHFYFT